MAAEGEIPSVKDLASSGKHESISSALVYFTSSLGMHYWINAIVLVLPLYPASSSAEGVDGCSFFSSPFLDVYVVESTPSRGVSLLPLQSVPTFRGIAFTGITCLFAPETETCSFMS